MYRNFFPKRKDQKHGGEGEAREPGTPQYPPGLHGTTQGIFVSVGQLNSLVERDGRFTRKDIVPLPKNSPDARGQFLLSMREMVSSRLQRNSAVDADDLVEISMRYLQLNQEEARKYVLKSFMHQLGPSRH